MSQCPVCKSSFIQVTTTRDTPPSKEYSSCIDCGYFESRNLRKPQCQQDAMMKVITQARPSNYYITGMVIGPVEGEKQVVNLVKLAEEAFKEYGIGQEHSVWWNGNKFEYFRTMADIEVDPYMVSDSLELSVYLSSNLEFQGVLRISKEKEIKFIWVSREDYEKQQNELNEKIEMGFRINTLINLGILENRG